MNSDDVTYLVTLDVVGVGLRSDNKFQPITSLVSIAMLGNEIVVGVTFLRYGGKHMTFVVENSEFIGLKSTVVNV